MNFSAWSIHRPIPALLLFVILTICGLFSFNRMNIQELPDMEFPVITVGIVLPGATPIQMETEVTRKIEASLATLGAVEHISSTVVEGASETAITFHINKDMRDAIEEVRNAVSSIRASLPSDVRDPYIARVRTNGTPILTYAVSSDSMDEVDLSWFVDDVVGKTLLSVQGVGNVIRHGGVRREVLIELDPIRLQSLNVTASEVAQQVLLVQQDEAGGHGKVGGGEQSLRSVGRVNTVNDLANLPVSLGSKQHSIRLGDIASVRDDVSERRNLALLNGRKVVSFQVSKAQGASDVAVANEIRTAIQLLMKKHPRVHVEEVSNSVGFTEDQYKSSMRALYEGAILTVIVVWIFLRDSRATLISAISLLLSIIPTFLVMHLCGYTLNLVTLLALTLVIGVLVDDVIVELENIVRHMAMGKTPLQAAIDAADEIGVAVIATSFALVAVFLPTVFIGGLSGRIFQQFGWTTSVAVIGSLLVARLIAPMLCAYLLRSPSYEHQYRLDEGMLGRRYLGLVLWCLAHPGKTYLTALAFFFVSFMLAVELPFDFIPAEDSHEITVNVTVPPGATIANTMSVVEAARQVAMKEPEVKSIFSSIGIGEQLGGNNFGGIGEVDTGVMILSLNTSRDRKRQKVEETLRSSFSRIPGARFSIGSGDSGEKYSVVLAGDESAVLQNTALQLAREMRGLSGFGIVSTSATMLRPEIVIRRDPVRASDLGVSTLAISQVLRVATGGDFDLNLAKLNLSTRQIPIRVRLDDKSRTDLEALSQLRMPGKVGPVPLSSVATLSLESGPSRIDRLDRSRVVTIDVELNGRPLSDAANLVDALPSMQKLPAGVSRVAIGDFKSQKEMAVNFFIAIVAGVVCVYMVLVLLLNDFWLPHTILSALPLSVVGAFSALWIFGYSFSLPSLVGIIMLMGVVTKNSILLVDYALIAQRDLQMSCHDAIVDACKKRARPVVMTTVAMVAGMLPMALGLQGDASFRAPMAVVVIGGLISSTFLSLIVVPVVYQSIDSMHKRILKLMHWLHC